jgi:crotonobetainyl-CoA:carnitine CoA-transferase CaiB-like acyl-CoA transferase
VSASSCPQLQQRSVATDLKREEGQAVIHRLVSTIDVIL